MKQPKPAPRQPRRLLTAEDVADMLAISKRTVWRMTASGELPQPVRYNRKLVRWTRCAIDAYLDRLEAEALAA
jgi:excisionase family DNA binding protein